MKKLPNWIYEALPYACITVGLLALSASLNILGALSALLLISAGAAIIKLRLDYRAPHQVMLRELRVSRTKPSSENSEDMLYLYAQI